MPDDSSSTVSRPRRRRSAAVVGVGLLADRRVAVCADAPPESGGGVVVGQRSFGERVAQQPLNVREVRSWK